MEMQQKRYFTILLLFLVLPGTLRAKPPPKKPMSDWEYYQKFGEHSAVCDPLVKAGLNAYESGNAWTAKHILDRAMGKRCKDALVYLNIGRVLEAMGGRKAAIGAYERAKPLLEQRYPTHPITPMIGELIGKLYFQLSDYDKALPIFLEVIQTRGENFERLYLVGQMYRIRGEPKPAITYLEKTLGHEASDTSPQLRLGVRMELLNLYVAQKDFPKAKEMIKSILAQDPSNPAALAVQENLRREESRELERKKWENILTY